MIREDKQTSKKAAGYVRVSRVGGRSGESYRSPSDQKAIIERLAAAHGLELTEIVVEEDVSGGKNAAQRELGRLVERVENGQLSTLLVWKVSRFSRSLLDGIVTASRVTEAGGRIIGEDLDTGAPMGKALLGLLLGLAEEELDQRREGWKRATDGAIARGIYLGRTPVGFTKDEKTQALRQNADAAVVREVFLARASGRSWNQLCSDFEQAGVKTATGATRWHMNSARSLIENPIYKGTLVNGHEHHFAEYAIVTSSEWEAAQPSKGAGNHEHSPRSAWAVLSGLVRCESCGSSMTVGRTVKAGRDYVYYRCQARSCSAQARVSADRLEAWVVQTTLKVLAVDAHLGNVSTGQDVEVEQIAALEQRIEDAKERRRQAALVLDVTDAKDAAALEQLSAEVEAAKADLTDAVGSQARRVTPDELVAGWPVWSVEERRNILRELYVQVKVAPQNGLKNGHGSGITLTLGDDTDTTSITLGQPTNVIALREKQAA